MSKASNLCLLTERGLSDTGTATLLDKSRYGHTGTLTAVTTTRLNSGIYVHNFNGSTSLISIPAHKSLSPYNKGGTWSASAWIKPTSDGESDLGQIFRQGGYWYMCVATEVAGTVTLRALIDYVTTDSSARSSTTMTLAAWHHVAMVHNRLGTYKTELYIDGSLCTLGTDTAGVGGMVDGGAEALTLSSAALCFDGSIAWWKVAAEAWTAGQVKQQQYDAERAWYGV